jgi:hypothetical protein
VETIPEERDARVAFLERWARGQQRRLAAEKQRRLAEVQLAAEEARADKQRRPYAEEIARVVAEARQRTGQVDSLRDVAVIPIVIAKPSDLPVDRAAVFADLMVRLREYKWADPIVSECDEPRYVAPEAIDLARRHRPDAPWLLYMEDDVILGPDFGLLPGLLREADELFPHTGMVSFFSGWIDEPGWSIHSIESFGWLQCVAIRNTDYLVGLRAFIDSLTQSAGKQSMRSRARHWFPASQRTRPTLPPDGVLGNFLAAEYDAYALWCPSLVQHADLASVFFGQTLPERISRSYEQAYG